MIAGKKLQRKKFIRLTFFSGVAAFLNSCLTGGNHTPPINDSSITHAALNKDSSSLHISNEPTFKLYKKGDSTYELLRKGFNKRIDKYPAFIAACSTTKEAAEAVYFGIKNKLPVAIKSGGHCFEGFSCNDNGLVINLSMMNTVEWLNDTEIKAGAGCRLEDLYSAILPKNKLLAAGSCGGVGIGGLTLGGGYGIFSREYGLACDSLTEVTMIDGKGNIVCSKDDPELLWACKGGGNGNFGVITSMKFTLQPAPSFLKSYRFKVRSIETLRAVNILQQWFNITSNLPPHCFSAFVLNEDSLYILLTSTKKITDIEQKIIDVISSVTDTTIVGKEIPLPRAVKAFYGIMKPIYFKNASAGFYKSFDDIKNCIEAVIDKVIHTNGMIYQVNTVGGKINDDALMSQSAYAHRDKKYLSELQCYWQHQSSETASTAAFIKVQKKIYDNGIRAQYRNYPDVNFKEWQDAYYDKNYSRLQKIKKRYDPDNIFSFEQSIKV